VDEKFAFLKAFMLDPARMGSITVEAEYVSQAEHDDNSLWDELPLSELRKLYTSDAQKKFLEEQIVAKQPGRCHPQDATGENQEMRLYWVFKQGQDVTRNHTRVGTRVAGAATLPDNKAAGTSLADHMVGVAADFGGKGRGAAADPGKGKGGGGKGGPQPKKNPKPKKARHMRVKCKIGFTLPKTFAVPNADTDVHIDINQIYIYINYISIYLSIYLFIYLSNLSIYLSIYLSLSRSRSQSLYITCSYLYHYIPSYIWLAS
jgi:hypothetical protein